MPHKVKPDGYFAEGLHAQMKKHDVDIKSLAIATGASYEHIRKLVNGLTTPSPILLSAITKHLKWNNEEARKLVIKDQMLKKYGDVPSEMAGKNPAFMKFERIIGHLTEEQQEMFYRQMKAIADLNR